MLSDGMLLSSIFLFSLLWPTQSPHDQPYLPLILHSPFQDLKFYVFQQLLKYDRRNFVSEYQRPKCVQRDITIT